ncbi:MAG: DEAD/DEAH box helicase [Deltaproteobacteria bacterium]|nr:DEAD/DEAH box helicase [Deltaproteobacteria bacterium]
MQTLHLTVSRDCKLSGAPPELIRELKKKLTLINPQYRDAVKYARWIGKNLKKELHFFTVAGNDIRFPRGFGNQAVLMCRKAGYQVEILDQRRLLDPVELAFNGDLRPYQEKGCAAMLSRDFGVLEAATGSGKTVMAAAIIAGRGQPALILIHTKELLYQWQERIRTFLGLEPGLIGDGSFGLAPVTVGLIHTVKKHLIELPAHFGHIIVDECHRTPSSMFTDIIKEFDCRFMLGLTATPMRRDGLTELIYWHIGDLVHTVSARDLDRHGAVLKPVIIERLTTFTFNYRRNYQDLMAALTQDARRNELIVNDIRQEVKNEAGTILVVSDRISHCETIRAMLAAHGLQPLLLTGRVAGEERGEIVRRVQQGEVTVLVATIQLIGEGFDCPGLTTLFLCTPIKFEGRLTQVIGRILRPAQGKEPKVYDYVDPVGVLKASAKARRQIYEMTISA